MLLQALLAGSSFCAFAAALRAAAPALTPADFPHLEAFAKLAKEFPVQKRTDEDEQAQQSQRKAQPEQPQRKAEPERPQPELHDNQAKPAVECSSSDAAGSNTVSSSIADEDVGAEAFRADAQAEDNSSAAAPASQAAAQADARPHGAQSDSNADAKEPARADGTAALKGSRASSRHTSCDGGPDRKTGKSVPKVPSNVKVSR